MSTSLLYHAYRIDGVKYKSTEFKEGEVIYHAEMTRKYTDCSKCGRLHANFKGTRVRRFHMIPFGNKPCFLSLEIHRLECPECHNMWWPSLPFMDGKRRMTRSFIQYVLSLLEMGTILAVAKLLRLSWDTVKELHKEKLRTRYRSISLSEIRAIGIDEFSIAKGHKYMTIITDLDTGRILHAVEGKNKEAVLPFLKKLRKAAPHLAVAAIDMAGSYAAALRETLPECVIVFDHFHVTALITKALDEVRREQQAKHAKNELKTLKGNRYLLLKNYDNLDPKKRNSLDALLLVNAPLAMGYAMKEQFRLFWGKTTSREGARFLCHWIIDAIESGVRPLAKVARSLLDHAEGLLSYFTHRVSNAITEGINNKIKTLKRQAYGYRDMEYFKLRLYHLHRQGYSLTG